MGVNSLWSSARSFFYGNCIISSRSCHCYSFIFSIFRFVFTGFFQVFSACAIQRVPGHVSWLPAFGIAVAMINFAVCVSFNFVDLYVGEWVTVGLFIGYILTLSFSKKAIIPIAPRHS